MVLNFPGVPQLFKQSRSNDEGIGKKKTEYAKISISGNDFFPSDNSQNVLYNSGSCESQVNSIALMCPIKLPDGCTITSIQVLGVATGETYILRRLDIVNANEDNMTTNIAINTKTTAISYSLIDNTKYAYYIRTSGLEIGELVFGGFIEYSN